MRAHARPRWESAARAVALSLLLALVASLPARAPRAFAHAAFERADPAPNAALVSAPVEVTIWFSEQLAASLSAIEVTDAARRRVDRADTRVDGVRMTVSLQPGLPAGVYTVAWHNVSDIDGHALRGAYAFAVGGATLDAAAQPPADASAPPTLASRTEPVARWLLLLGGALALGAVLFGPAVGAPALAVLAPRDAGRLRAAAAAPLGRVVVVGAALFLLASGVQLVAHAAAAAALPATDVRLAELRAIADTDWGRRWSLRVVLAIAALAVFAAAGALAARGRERPALGALLEWLVVAALGAALLTISLTSHGAATAGLAVPGTLADALHLLAAAAWTGGLVALLLTLRAARALAPREQRRYAAAAVPRFSALAALAVAALLLSGAYASWLQVTAPRAFTTPYGAALLAKLALAALLLSLGAFNLLWLRPRLRAADTAVALLRRTLAAEIALALLVLAAAALLTSIEPARQVQTREELARGLVVEQRDGGVRVRVQLQPGAAGPNRATIELRDDRGPVVTQTGVRLAARPAGSQDAAPAVTATVLGGGRYAIGSLQLPTVGVWQLTIDAARPDGLDVRAALEVALPARPPDASQVSIAPDPERGRLLWAGVVAGFGLVVLWLVRLAARSRVTRVRGATLGIALALAGVVLFYGADAQPSANANPVPFTAASIAAGRELYASRCAECHGAAGRGDGPRASALRPPPVDLTVHVPLHQESQIFTFIARGITGTAMPAFSPELAPEQIWSLVNYLQTLAQPPADR